MLKSEKVAFVQKMTDEVKKHKTVGVMPIDAIPDRLVQKIRNELKPDTKMFVARKNLVDKILGNSGLENLVEQTKGNVAILVSDKDPFDLYNVISSNSIRLIAKPNQIAPQEIRIEQGETSIPPGQAVTDLKAAGIDVQIQKGKVVISKSKVVVEKGAKISTAVSKALKLLDIMPFEARGKVRVIYNNKVLFTSNALGVTPEVLASEIAKIFSQANVLTTSVGYPTVYNVNVLLSKAFNNALYLGVDRKIYEKEAVEKLLGIAALQGGSVNSLIKKE
ncbi:MAG: 50S ribosomal protein L10 [Candidatus Marsarchaeota archaeon]|jgi:large subunit ribosomal protein L10|nr:50S ribosomal protein L10 [Candidatus Marsarchaeota archaeon]